MRTSKENTEEASKLATIATSGEHAAIDLLLQSSQRLWREATFERLVNCFVQLQKEHFGVKHAVFYTIRMVKSKVTLVPTALELKSATIFSQGFLKVLDDKMSGLNLKSQEYRLGLNTLHCNGRDVCFALLGDPAADWYLLVWELVALDQGQKQAAMVFGDFLVKQLQSGCSWFSRLDKTQALLYRDDLTGLFNSRYLDVAIESEIRRVQRFQTSFCLLFIDLDNFKEINDKFGHLCGSDILKQVANVLLDASREVDSVFRYGGDEFIILLLGANPTTGLLAAERIRRRMAETKFEIQGHGFTQFTASIGVASFPEHAKDKETLLRLADETMYVGKRNGKNKVILVGQPGSRSIAEVEQESYE